MESAKLIRMQKPLKQIVEDSFLKAEQRQEAVSSFHSK